MSEIRAIPYGQADCFLITLDDGCRKRHILIDGGSKLWSGKGLSEYLKEMKLGEIELLVLTHLHQDHIGWLKEVSQSIKIHQAVLPFSPETAKQIAQTTNQEVKEDYQSLLAIEQNLFSQKTKVLYANKLSKYMTYIFGEYRFTAIYPDVQSRLPFYDTFGCEKNVSQNAGEKAVSLLNGDSSVWLLTKEKKQVALFCGDCFESNFAENYQKYVTEQGLYEGIEVLKLSHHGRNDKGHVYFTEQFVNQIKPDQIWITNTGENALIYQEQWKAFSKKSEKKIIGEKGRVQKIR